MVIDCGADPNVMDGNGMTPLVCCIINAQHTQHTQHNKSILTALIERGANPNMPDSCGRHPLLMAHSEPKLFDYLIQLDNIDVTVTDGDGNNLAKLTRDVCEYKITRSIGTLEQHKFYTQFIVGLLFFLLMFIIFRNI
jgi:hypothetical protein